MQFAGDADVRIEDLALAGTSVGSDGIVSFYYNPITFNATWTLANPLGTGRIPLQLRNAGLDIWSTTLEVLPGDVDRSSAVDRADLVTAIHAMFGLSSSGGTADIDGNGAVELVDLVAVRDRLGTLLPEPPASLSPAAADAALATTTPFPRAEPSVPTFSR